MRRLLIPLSGVKLFGIVLMRILVPLVDSAALANVMSDLNTPPEKRERLALRMVDVVGTG